MLFVWGPGAFDFIACIVMNVSWFQRSVPISNLFNLKFLGNGQHAPISHQDDAHHESQVTSHIHIWNRFMPCEFPVSRP